MEILLAEGYAERIAFLIPPGHSAPCGYFMIPPGRTKLEHPDHPLYLFGLVRGVKRCW